MVAQAARHAYVVAPTMTTTTTNNTNNHNNDDNGGGGGGTEAGESSFVWPGRGPEGATVAAVLIPCDPTKSATEVRLPCAVGGWYLRAAADALGAPDAFPHSRKVGAPRDVAHYTRKAGGGAGRSSIALKPQLCYLL